MPEPGSLRPEVMRRRLGDSINNLDVGYYPMERLLDDLNPRNLGEIDRELEHPLSRHPRAQEALRTERRRLEDMQGQMMWRAAERFKQQLGQQLNPRIGTSEDADPQALFMFRLMRQMRRRHGR